MDNKKCGHAFSSLQTKSSLAILAVFAGVSELLTIEEVATILNVWPDTATRRFAKVKGVIDIGSPETPKRRRYRVLRVPKSVVEKYLLARGGPVEVKAPNRPKKPRSRKC